jgi:preprotein translocase subunit SecA
MRKKRKSSLRPAKSGAVTIATNMAGRGTDNKAGRQRRVSGKERSEKSGIPDEIIEEATGYAENGQ